MTRLGDDERTEALSDGDEAELLSAGWARIDGTAGWWRDPQSGRQCPPWRALHLARRDRQDGAA